MEVYQNPASQNFSYEIDFWRSEFQTCFYALMDSYKNHPDYPLFKNKMPLLVTYYNRVSNLRLNRLDLFPELHFKDTLF